MATKEYLENRIAGREKEIEKLTKKLARIEKAKSFNYEEGHNPYYYDECDLRNCLYDLEQATKQLEKYQTQLEQQVEKDNSKKVEVIVTFLNNWKATCKQFYVDNFEKYLEAGRKYNKDVKAVYAENLHFTETVDKLDKLKKMFVMEWGAFTEYDNEGKLDTEKLDKDLENEANRKYDFIIERTNEIVGEITDASELEIADNGELNGFIKGTKGNASVRTIDAGGYNIQCYHFRTLIKKVK